MLSPAALLTPSLLGSQLLHDALTIVPVAQSDCPTASRADPSCLQAVRQPLLCCRTEYLGQTLDSLSSLSGLDKVTVYVSQDGHDVAVGDLVQHYGQDLLAPPHTSFFDHWQRDRVPQLGPNQASQSKTCTYLTSHSWP